MKSSGHFANHFLRQQQDALNAQLAALFQDDSEPLSEIRTRCDTVTDGAEHHQSRLYAAFCQRQFTLCRVLTDVIRPIENKSTELSESGFRPGFHFRFFTA